jgi:6-phospho-3-hexuloisomerase
MIDYTLTLARVLAELEGTLRGVEAAQLDALRAAIRTSGRIFVVGRGRSGLMLRAFAMRLMHLGLTAYVVDETTTPAIGADDLLIVGSGSGGTEVLIAAAARARAHGAQVALLTANPDAPLLTHADLLVYIPAPHKHSPGGAQPMGTPFEQALLVLLDVVILQLMDELGETGESMIGRHANLD